MYRRHTRTPCSRGRAAAPMQQRRFARDRLPRSRQPSQVEELVGSPEFERAEGKEGAKNPDDPESHNHLRLGPSFHLKMMVQRRSQENSMLSREVNSVTPFAILEDVSLENYRYHLSDEQSSHKDEQEFGL